MFRPPPLSTRRDPPVPSLPPVLSEERGLEAVIIERQAQLCAPLVGGLGPGGADLGAADEDAVAGGVLAGGAGLWDDADVLGLNAEGNDFAGELVVAGL